MVGPRTVTRKGGARSTDVVKLRDVFRRCQQIRPASGNPTCWSGPTAVARHRNHAPSRPHVRPPGLEPLCQMARRLDLAGAYVGGVEGTAARCACPLPRDIVLDRVRISAYRARECKWLRWRAQGLITRVQATSTPRNLPRRPDPALGKGSICSHGGGLLSSLRHRRHARRSDWSTCHRG